MTVLPGVAVATSALVAMVSLGMSTATVAVHAATPEVGQLLPDAVDRTELLSSLSPGSGFLTVTEYVIVTRAPTARSPVQVSIESARLSDPVGPDGVTCAAASLL